MSDSLQLHGLQHTRLPCPSPMPRACSNSWSSSWWCHPTISSSVIPFFSCLQSFPASGSFPMSWHFTSVGQSIGASASTSVLPKNIQDWIPLLLTSFISLQSKGLPDSLLHLHSSKASVLMLLKAGAQPSLWSNSHIKIRCISADARSPCSPRDSQESSPIPQFKSISSLVPSLLYDPTLTSTHDTGKTIAFSIQTLVSKVMFLLLNTV